MNLNPFKRNKEAAPEPERDEPLKPKYTSQLVSNVAPEPIKSDIVVHEPLPGVVPPDQRESAVRLAADSMPMDYMGVGGFTGGFLGYPYLADLAQRPEYRNMVETVAEEMTRKWIELKSTGESDKSERIKRLDELMDKFDVKGCFRKAIEDDGYFGRGQIYLDVDTPSGKRADEVEDELSTPLFMSKSKIKKGSLRGIRVIEPQWTYPSAYQAEKPWAKDFYKPQRWFVMGRTIHASRFCMIVSRPVPDILKAAYNFGGLSLSQMAEPYVNNWIRTRNSVSDLIHSFSLTVLATDLGSLTQINGDALIKRLDLFTKMRDNRGIFAINKDDESIEQHNTPLSGLSDLQAQSLEHLSYVTKEPLVKLTGITPSGLNATSDGEIRVWYDHVHARQEDDIRPGLKKVLDILQLHEFGDIDDEITFDFVPLHELSEEEEANIRKTDSETAENYVGMGAVSPDDVRETLVNDEDSPYHGLSGPAPTSEVDDGAAPRMASDEWSESDHPRDDDGQFSSGGGSSGGSTEKASEYKKASSSKEAVSQSRAFSEQQDIELKDYKEGGYKAINEMLRSGENLSEGYQEIVDEIDKALANSKLKSDTTLYRGIEHRGLAKNAEQLIGRDIKIDSFQSTSTSEGVAKSFAGMGSGAAIFEIQAPAGTGAVNMDQFEVAGNANENEVLIGRGQKLKIESVDRSSGVPVIRGRIVSAMANDQAASRSSAPEPDDSSRFVIGPNEARQIFGDDVED